MPVDRRLGLSAGAKRLWRWLAGTLAGLAIVAALAVGAFRLALDLLPEYEARVAADIRAATGLGLSFDALDARIGRYGPEVYFEGARIAAPDGSGTLVSARAGRASLAPLRSLLRRRLEVGRVILEEPRLNFVIFPDRHVELVGQGWLPRPDAAPRSQGGLERVPRGVLEIRDAVLGFVDLRDGGQARWELSEVDLELSRKGDAISLVGGVRLPAQLGEALEFDAGVEGDLERIDGMTWRARLVGRQVDLAGWTSFLPPGYRLPASGRGDFRISARGEGREFRRGRAVLDLGDVALPSVGSAAPVVYRRLAGDLRVRHERGGWQADGTGVELSLPDSPWRPTAIAASVDLGDDRVRAFVIDAGYLRLENLVPFAALAPESTAGAGILALAPRGILEDIRLDIRDAGAGAVPDVSGSLSFRDVGFEPRGKVPGFEGLAGRVAGEGEAGTLRLDARRVRVDWPGRWRETVEFPRLAADMGWSRAAGGVRVWADDALIEAGDGSAQGRARVLVRRGESPLMDIAARVRIDDLTRIARFFPIDRIKPKPLKWLDEAFGVGRVSEGRVEITGPARGFPYRNGEGRFRATARAEGVHLHYAPGWKPAMGIDATVEFAETGMSASVAAGRVGEVDIDEATVSILDWRDAPLVLNGRAHGDAAAVHDLLVTSSIGPALGPTFARVVAAGNVAGDVSMVLPLRNLAERMVTVHGRAAGITLQLQGMAATASDVAGDVWLRNREIYAPDLQARLLGGPARLAIDTRAGRGDELVTTVTGSGAIDAARLPDVVRLPRNAGIEGTTPWRASWTATRSSEPGGFTRGRIHVESSLAGLVSGLPAPFAKERGESRPLALDIDMDRPAALTLRATLGRDLRAVAELQRGDAGFSLARALVRFGGGEATALPVGPGLVLDGRLPSLSISDLTGLEWPTPATRRLEDLLARATLEVGRLEVLGHEFDAVQGRLRPGSRGWDIEVEAPAASGRLQVPYRMTGDVPLVADLARLAVKPRVRTGGGDTDPRRLPSMQVDIRDLDFLGFQLGHTTAVLERAATGLSLDRFTVEHPAYRASGRGSWLTAASGQRGALSFELESGDVRGFLRAFTLAPVMEAKRGTLVADVTWPGAPDADVLKRLSGSVRIDMREGRMLSVEPGAGRILGLMSLAHLPKRLSLDFGDLTGKGLAFDSVKGSFALADGDAYTDDLTLRGAAAEVGLAGRTSLRDRSYDQTAVVTGDLGGSLGVAGALAGGPAVGAVVLLFSQIFKEPLKGVARGYYRITGSWDDPLVRKIEARELEEAAGLGRPPAAGGAATGPGAGE